MAEVNQEIARRPETQEKMSEAISAKWQEKEYQENVSKGVSGKWQKPKFRERQFNAKVYGKREIPDRAEFLKEIQSMKKKDLNTKYDMDGKCINDRIKEMLGHHGIENFSQAKKYLEDKNLDNVLKDINRKLENQSQKFVGKKEITNRKEFLKDIQNMQRKDIDHKYDMNRSTVNKRIREMLGDYGVKNYTEAKKYLEGKNLDKVAKEINERLSNQSQKFEGKSIISNKREFLNDIKNLQKNEIDHKYGMDAKVREFNEREAKRVPKGSGFIDDWDYPVDERDLIRNDWDHLGPGSPTGGKDYQGILENSPNGSTGGNNDYEGIYEGPEGKEKDFEGIDEDSREKGKDSDDIDDSSGEGKTDAHYEQIDEDYAGREYGGEG
ncbi:hypothetical protein ES703_119589 [subsurface metagenome]